MYVYLPGRDHETEGEHFSGPAEWNREAMHFADTDTLMFQFCTTDSFSAEDHGNWGYRCTVTGKACPPPSKGLLSRSGGGGWELSSCAQMGLQSDLLQTGASGEKFNDVCAPPSRPD